MTSDDADNPNIKCTRKKVKETCRFIRWVMTTSEQNGNVMSCHAYWLTTKVSSPQKVDLNQPLMIGAVLYSRVTLCQLCLIMTLGVIKREGVLGACPFEVLHIIDRKSVV